MKLPDLSNFKLAPHLLPPKLPFPFIDNDRFEEIVYSAEYIDVLTYSISPRIPHIRRAIYVEGQPPPKCQAVRVTATHAKLWLIKMPKKYAAFVGSANATAMTIFEIVYWTNSRQTLQLTSFFDELWKRHTSEQ